MKNIVIVKNNLVALPYITNISNIRYSPSGRFLFVINDMFDSEKVIASEKLNVPSMWSAFFERLTLTSVVDLEHFSNLFKPSRDEKVFTDDEILFITNEYVNLQLIRQRLITEWDKCLSNISRIDEK